MLLLFLLSTTNWRGLSIPVIAFRNCAWIRLSETNLLIPITIIQKRKGLIFPKNDVENTAGSIIGSCVTPMMSANGSIHARATLKRKINSRWSLKFNKAPSCALSLEKMVGVICNGSETTSQAKNNEEINQKTNPSKLFSKRAVNQPSIPQQASKRSCLPRDWTRQGHHVIYSANNHPIPRMRMQKLSLQ